MKTNLSVSYQSLATLRLQPNGGELIAVSTSDSDTQNVFLTDGTTDSVVSLTGKIEAETGETWSALTRVNLSTPVGAVTLRRQGTKGAGYFSFYAQPAVNSQVVIGLVGHERTYTFKGTLTGAADEVKIGLSYAVTVRNLCRALQAGTGAGTDYGTGTVAHAHLDAYGDSAFTVSEPNGTSNTTVYLRDKLACLRQLGWTISVVSGITGLAPTGGANGDLICEIAPGQLGAGTTFELSSNAAINVPDGFMPTFDAIQTYGRQSRLFIKGDSGGGSVEFTIRGGPDPSNLVTQDVVTTSGSTLVQSDIIGPCEFVQVEITDVTGDNGVLAALVF